MKAVLLAGGLGTRIAEESEYRPKPMIEIGGRPILWHVMKTYAHHGVTDFIVCCGYKGYVIKEYFANYCLHQSDITVDLVAGVVTHHKNGAEPWRVTLVDTGLDTMTGGRLKRVTPYLDPGSAFCMTYGDGVADIDVTALVDFHRSHGRLATLTATVPPGRYGALEMEGEAVRRFTEKPPGDNAHINGGFFVLEPGVLDLIDGDETAFEGAPLERLAADDQLRAFRHDGFWRPMDTLRDKRQLEALWQSGAPWKVWP
ncbi:glucose-1-phosphate cytidylyltransferase [Rubrimonas cliftonensis]|uniref:Glucose-1-phosphate cytidylyltransferase n=1 Tax=Rubrimonas cliftonensis TaxID=89524 RepID=A0A1H4G8J3_9RHOB|nr:glucose-1-phosphate cytidylyltransferase [Rubrimonas cliftonensis]SEB05330.1 glucose-1-phosphate cytidylyltransferase [Rubrimonas cliftonensis]